MVLLKKGGIAMFDINMFKNQFRIWSEQNPWATIEDFHCICKQLMPENFQEQYAWLVDQSRQWFFWKQESLKRDLLLEMELFRDHIN